MLDKNGKIRKTVLSCVLLFFLFCCYGCSAETCSVTACNCRCVSVVNVSDIRDTTISYCVDRIKENKEFENALWYARQ